MDLPDVFEKTLSSAYKKLDLLENSPGRYFLLAMLAGAYLTIVGFVYWTIRNNFGNSPAGGVLAALFFGVGLSVIIFTGAELFTSNNMYLAISTLERRNSAAATARLWTICWLGNLTGAVIVASLLWEANATVLPEGHALLEGVRHKISMPAGEIFAKAMLANWVVCLAVWLNNQLKEEIARLAAIILVVFIFLYLGFEHSIANMGYFATALMADPNLPVGAMARNLVWATLGNIVGGGVGLGVTSWLVYRKPAVRGATATSP